MKKLLATALVAAVTTMGMVAPGQAAIEEGKLVVWINGDKGYNGLAEVGKRFTAETGIRVEVAHPDKATDKFQQAAATGNGPDIFIWAHDRFGEWAQSGLISALDPSDEFRDSVAGFTWDAVTYDNKIYGYPIALEAVGLIYNKALVKNPPKTFEEIFELDHKLQKQGKKAILWDYNNTYFSWGLFAANDGYAFKRSDAGYDVADTGVNNDGSLKGATMIRQLIDKGVMPEGADYGVMDAAFNKGEVAMVINGPWSWSNFSKSGIDFGVARIPSIDGNVGRPFTGVLAAAMNSASPNQDLAQEFLEHYMLTIEGLRTINDDVALGAVANKALMKELASDPRIEATFENASIGRPMPNIPEMGAFWAAMEPALKNITSGRQGVQEALDGAAKRIVKN